MTDLLTPPRRASLMSALGSLLLAACGAADTRPMPAVSHVDLSRFMGDWYVIAHIPTWPERNAFDAIESYERASDGRILTTFRYRNGSFAEPVSDMHPVATVRPGTGDAIWDMQFFWPFKSEYVIAYLDADYTQTVIARSARDYAWLMARSPALSEADRVAHTQRIEAMGYDIAQLRWVPQQAATSSEPPNADSQSAISTAPRTIKRKRIFVGTYG